MLVLFSTVMKFGTFYFGTSKVSLFLDEAVRTGGVSFHLVYYCVYLVLLYIFINGGNVLAWVILIYLSKLTSIFILQIITICCENVFKKSSQNTSNIFWDCKHRTWYFSSHLNKVLFKRLLVKYKACLIYHLRNYSLFIWTIKLYLQIVAYFFLLLPFDHVAWNALGAVYIFK